MYCTECGKEINQGFKFCPHCGFNLQQALSTISPQPPSLEQPSQDSSEVAKLVKQFGTVDISPNIYQNSKLRLREIGQAIGYNPVREYFFKETPQSPLRKIDIVWKSTNGFAAAFNIKSKWWRLEFADDLEQVSRLASFNADRKYIVNVSKRDGTAFFIELTKDLVKSLGFQMKTTTTPPTFDSYDKAYNVDMVRQTYEKAYEKWTPQEDKQIVEEFTHGLTVVQIAQKHQRQRGAVYSRLNKLINVNGNNNLKQLENKPTSMEVNQLPIEGQFIFLVKSKKNMGTCLACLDKNKLWIRPITAGGFAEKD